MKSYTKSELARAAGVSGDTFRRWLKTDREFLRANNVQPKTKYLPPVVVKYLCEKYCIDVWLVIGDWLLVIGYWIWAAKPHIHASTLYTLRPTFYLYTLRFTLLAPAPLPLTSRL